MCIRDSMSTTYRLSEPESPSTGHCWNEQGFHIMIISVYIWAQLTIWMNIASPSTGHGWNEQGFHIMIISVYIWAQLTDWVNPSHRTQGMVGMGKVFTLWSLVCTYEHNLHPEWIQVTVHRAWLEWARFSHHDHQRVHQRVHMSTTYHLNEYSVTVHRAWLEWARFSHHDH